MRFRVPVVRAELRTDAPVSITKRTLGVGYLVGTGSALTLVLVGRAGFAEMDRLASAGTVTGFVLSLTLVYAGLWLVDSELDGDRVWRVTRWGGVGVSAFTAVGLFAVFGGPGPPREAPAPFLLLSNVAAGGVVGVLVGGIRQLEEEHARVATLNERNDVLNRVLRHNVRNDMNVVLGHAERVRTELPDEHAESAERIRQRARELLRVSGQVRRASKSLQRGGEPPPVDLVPVVEEALELYGPDVEADLPGAAVVRADDSLDLLVESVLRAARQYGATPPTVRVTVRNGPDATLRVRTDGEGIPPAEREALRRGSETPLEHTTGIDLWVVKWLAESYGGEFAVEDPHSVRVRFPVP
ncbi:MAG: sensor histidine kinase [Halobacteriaceae archaeon]